MTVVRVNPQSVHAYGADAQEKFTEIRTQLQTLVNEVTEVRYFGPNAVDFKTRAGQMAAEFANNLNKDLGAIAEAIRTSTSNIAASLGGAPLQHLRSTDRRSRPRPCSRSTTSTSTPPHSTP